MRVRVCSFLTTWSGFMKIGKLQANSATGPKPRNLAVFSLSDRERGALLWSLARQAGAPDRSGSGLQALAAGLALISEGHYQDTEGDQDKTQQIGACGLFMQNPGRSQQAHGGHSS